MTRFICYFIFSISLVHSLNNHTLTAEEISPVPDADYGKIKLREPLPDRATIYANWLHDHKHGFRVLVPPMSTVHCLQEPDQENAYTILLRILPFEMEVVDIGLISTSVDGKTVTAEQLLDAIPADEKHNVFHTTSTVGTTWTGQASRTLDADAPPPLLTMLARKNENYFLFARFRSLTQMEFRTVIAIIDSISFVQSNFSLADVLKVRYFEESKTDFLPHRTARAWFENDRANGLVTHEDAQGRRVYTLTWLNGRQAGLEIQHWPSGGVYRLGLYENDLAQGQRVTFYETGEVHTLIDVQNGVREGKYAVYYRNGNLADVVDLKAGFRHGVCLHYLPNGNLIGRTHFENGKEFRKEVVRELSQSEYESTLEAIPAPHSVWNVAR